MKERTANSTLSQEGWMSRTMRRRYGILMLVSLVCWPLVGFWRMLEAVVVNGMYLETYHQLAFLVFTNLVAMVFCVATLRLLNSRISGRWLPRLFGSGAQPWTLRLWTATSALSLLPVLTLTLCFSTEFVWTGQWHIIATVVAIMFGGILAYCFLALVGWIKCMLVGSSAEESNFFPFETRDSNGFVNRLFFLRKLSELLKWPGLKFGLEDSDFQFAAYFSLLAASHWLTARWSRDSYVQLMSAPAMVVLLIWISCMLFGGVANLFDRFRLPIVAIFLVGVTLWQIPWSSSSSRPLVTVRDDSSLQLVKRVAAVSEAENAHLATDPEKNGGTSRQDVILQATKNLDEDAWMAVENRMKQLQSKKSDPKKGKTLVVVTCPGGGIHAAAWAACVLESISAEYSDFADSIAVISSVSGGSVGTLCFISTEFHNELTGEKIPNPGSALELASRSALEPIAYGMVTDDLYGAFIPPLSLRDRGQRLEDHLSFRLPESQRHLTMGHWGDLAAKGKLPIVIFNATDAATGRRILFDTLPTPVRLSNVGLLSRPINYRELLAVEKSIAFDVRPASAARTSATFPYISPFTRPKDASDFGKAVAICDGGYADNEGIVTVINWVDFILRRWLDLSPETRPFDRILILRIAPNATVDSNTPPATSGPFVWFRWLSGPAETIAKVRSASQSERGNLESDLAALDRELKQSKSTQSDTIDRNEIANRLPKTLRNSYTKPRDVDPLAEKTAFDQHKNSKEENRKLWQSKVQSFKMQLKSDTAESNPSTPSPSTTPPPVAEEDKNRLELPVVVQTVAFQNSDQVVPLNWKLTKEQKLWYLLSWKISAAQGTPLRKTLDAYFTRAPKSPIP